MVLIVLPVYNEAFVLEKNALAVLDFCRKNLNGDWKIIVADNNSADRTAEIGKKLASVHREIEYFFTVEQGKGRGVLGAWTNFAADVYVFMDADLASDLGDLPRLVESVKSGADIAVGSRYAAGAQARRSWSRNFISGTLRAILRLFFNLKVGDAPCGFKAVNPKVVREIVPLVRSKTWFFDTELLVLAEKRNLKIVEIPIKWIDDRETKRESKVNIISVVFDYLRNIVGLYKRIHKKTKNYEL